MSTFEDQRRLRPFLLPGERIAWTGRPQKRPFRGGVSWAVFSYPSSLAILAFMQFAIARQERDDPVFQLFQIVLGMALILFAAVCLLLGPVLRRRMLYALTNQRALVLGRKGRNTVESHDLAWLPMVLLEDRDELGTITMEDEPERERLFHIPWRSGAEHSGFAFVDIERPRHVYELIVRGSRDRRLELERDPLPEALYG